MNLNNTAVKPKSEVEEKVAIAIYEAAGAKNSIDSDCIGEDHYIAVVDGSVGQYTTLRGGKELITLDQLIWESDVAPDDSSVFCCWYQDRLAWFEKEDNIYEGAVLISTRPQQEETKGYMPEVGEDCRYETFYFVKNSSNSGTCKPIAYHEMNGKKLVWLQIGKMDSVIPLDGVKFKPLKTKEEEEREEFIKVCIEFAANAANFDRVWLFGALYDHLKENNLLSPKD